MKIVVACPEAQSPVQMPPPRNPNLNRSRISEAYLKEFLGIVSRRIHE
jgi:hypothetical protein